MHRLLHHRTHRSRQPTPLGLLVALVVVITMGCASSGQSSATGATVTRIVDGDTIVVDIDGDEHTLRLIGIDTPETHHPSLPVECFGPEATERITEMIPPGTAVHLERDDELRDLYGRVLAYVFRADDDMFVNEVLVAEGYATTLVIAPNTTYSSRFAGAEREARSHGAGLWGACR